MEVNWKCAGICEASNKYLFSDVRFLGDSQILYMKCLLGESRRTESIGELFRHCELEALSTEEFILGRELFDRTAGSVCTDGATLYEEVPR